MGGVRHWSTGQPRTSWVNRRGVCYDVGAVMLVNWRPDLDPRTVKRELQIIRDDLHCNAVRITGRDLKRLETAAHDALDHGLEVWLSPVPRVVRDARDPRRSGTRRSLRLHVRVPHQPVRRRPATTSMPAA